MTRAALLGRAARLEPMRARRYAAGSLLATALALAACATHAPEHFYTVSGAVSPPASATTAKASPALRGDAARVIRVDALLLPELINRPQLVLRSADHEVKIFENDRWAGPLADDLGAVLRADLQQADPDHDYVMAGGPRSEDAVWQLQVQIGQLDAGPGTELHLQASWVLRDRARAPLAQGALQRAVPAGAGAGGGEPAAIVRGYGAAMQALAAAITESMGALRRADPTPAAR